MGGLFNVENPFWTFVGKLSDAMLLGAIWLLCCVTVVCAGPATTALYYVTLKMVRNEENYVFKMFWKSFKENFRQGAIIGVINLGLAVFIAYDLWFYYHQETQMAPYLFMLFLAFAFVWIIGTMYIFAILAKFSNGIKAMYVSAYAMAVRHFATTLICLAIMAACVTVVIFVPPLIVFIGGVYMFFTAFPLRKVMDIYTQKILERQAAMAALNGETSETDNTEETPASEPEEDVSDEDAPAEDEKEE